MGTVLSLQEALFIRFSFFFTIVPVSAKLITWLVFVFNAVAKLAGDKTNTVKKQLTGGAVLGLSSLVFYFDL